MINALFYFSKFVDIPSRVKSIWKYERMFGYMED
jgi:hypothetical protein